MNRSKSSNIQQDYSNVIGKILMKETRFRKHHLFGDEYAKGCNPITPTKKPIQEGSGYRLKMDQLIKSYHKIIDRLELQLHYQESLLLVEKCRYEQYYDQMIRMIENEKNQGIDFLQGQIIGVRESFGVKIGCLQNKIKQLQGRNVQTIEKEVLELQAQKSFELEVFTVQQVDLTEFMQHINQYLLKCYAYDVLPVNSIVRGPEPYFCSEDIHDQIGPPSENPQQNVSPMKQLEKDSQLGCDEQLGSREDSKRDRFKKKRYDVDDVSVICEEDESNESSVLTEQTGDG